MKAENLAEAIEIITLLAEELPEECYCNPETDSEGRTVGSICLPHRAQEWLREATA